MSNRRKLPVFDAMGDHRIPGGCTDCDAFQTVHRDHGLYLLTVHHDDTCPYYRKAIT